ncbi:MAG: sulfotransferase [Rhizobiales bacterium]|nr:sulfotransferase [Hyphomicrobiales bacterium]
MDIRNELAAAGEAAKAVATATNLLSAGRRAEAKAICQKLLNKYPRDAEAHNLMGVIAISDTRQSEALHHFQTAVSYDPNNVGYLNNLGRLFMRLNRIELAIPVFMRIMKLDPKFASAVTAIAEFFQKMGRADKGLPILDNYLASHPNSPTVIAMKAQALETLGRESEAEAIYLQLERTTDLQAFSLNRLANLRKQKSASPLIDRINQQLRNPSLKPEQSKLLHGAAGKVYEDIGDYDQAFASYAAAAAFDVGGFNIELCQQRYERLMSLFTPQFFRDRRALGHESGLPVLVVGMPRSGTTLTEQIIGRHPDAAGAGELMRLRSMARTLGFKKDISGFIGAMQSVNAEQVRVLAENYLQLLRFYSKSGQRVVDKLPHNFEMLGFASLLFPNMHVIHCRRDAIDTCLSIYVNRFNESHQYANDLTTLGSHYRQYAALMDHWREVLPVSFFESDYEALTDNPDQGARDLIAATGLPWNDACLSHVNAPTTVMTLSVWQVRQPVYKTSVKRWKRFEKHLGPLIEALGDRAEAA